MDRRSLYAFKRAINRTLRLSRPRYRRPVQFLPAPTPLLRAEAPRCYKMAFCRGVHMQFVGHHRPSNGGSALPTHRCPKCGSLNYTLS